jgi:hypothetical protein
MCGRNIGLNQGECPNNVEMMAIDRLYAVPAFSECWRLGYERQRARAEAAEEDARVAKARLDEVCDETLRAAGISPEQVDAGLQRLLARIDSSVPGESEPVERVVVATPQAALRDILDWCDYQGTLPPMHLLDAARAALRGEEETK